MKIHVNGEIVEVDRREYISIHDLLNDLNIDVKNDDLHVEIDGDTVERNRWLKEGARLNDHVEITYE